jgi:hypothetical protein
MSFSSTSVASASRLSPTPSRARLTNWTVDAIATIGHEASHLRGSHNERIAECAGVRFAYSYLHQIGAFREYDAAGVKSQLLDDSGRPAEYKLHHTCAIA